jgi:hypothetical protein
MLPGRADSAVRYYLRVADRLLPGRVDGLYVVGSIALGAYRLDLSDIDLVVTVDRQLTAAEIRRARLLHGLTGMRSWAKSFPRAAVPGTCNATFVRSEELDQPVSTITPILNHCGHEFAVGRGFDVNPVVWQILDRHGIAVRGPSPDTLRLQPQPELLRDWNLANLRDYWRPWAEGILAGGRRQAAAALFSRARTEWGVLGAPRLHHTIATGDVISKERAGEYSLDVFDEEWHPIIREGLAYSRGEAPVPDFTDRRGRVVRAAEFVCMVADSATTAGVTYSAS